MTKRAGEESVNFIVQLAVHHPGKSGQELEAETDSEAIEKWFLLTCSFCFYIVPGTTIAWSTVVWVPLHQPSIQKMQCRPIWWGWGHFSSRDCFSDDSSICQISSRVSFLDIGCHPKHPVSSQITVTDTWNLGTESALARITLLKLDSMRQVKYYPAAPKKWSRLVKSPGHLLSLQRFWSHALPTQICQEHTTVQKRGTLGMQHMDDWSVCMRTHCWKKLNQLRAHFKLWNGRIILGL